MKMVEEFHMIVDMILGDNDLDNLDDFGGFARLDYYKMLLWINLKDEEKIKEVCSMITKSFKARFVRETYCRSSRPYSDIRRSWKIYPMSLWDKECPISKKYLLALCDKDQHKEVLTFEYIRDSRHN
ncbi:Pentatricopeptide repeat-containing protein [Cardamine amara subsp. amara]|uniref:Pentatricopeptide repeat-containing protein n=1 Tax=Cardamine amara subsp. amara TaxID=228776 RepID=A0ABD1BVC9_CARAN